MHFPVKRKNRSAYDRKPVMKLFLFYAVKSNITTFMYNIFIIITFFILYFFLIFIDIFHVQTYNNDRDRDSCHRKYCPLTAGGL